MLHYIKGPVVMRLPGGIVVEAGGLGYEINVPDNSSAYLKSDGEQIMLYLYMAVREDDVSLFGFSEREGLILFKQLLTVSGVGAKAAMAIMSSAPLHEIKKAIAFEDAVFLTRANGIGKKTAQRVVLELKDKMGAIDSGSSGEGLWTDAEVIGSDERTEAANALMALGYSRAEASSAMAAIKETGLSSQEYIRLALKRLF